MEKISDALLQQLRHTTSVRQREEITNAYATRGLIPHIRGVLRSLGQQGVGSRLDDSSSENSPALDFFMDGLVPLFDEEPSSSSSSSSSSRNGSGDAANGAGGLALAKKKKKSWSLGVEAGRALGRGHLHHRTLHLTLYLSLCGAADP